MKARLGLLLACIAMAAFALAAGPCDLETECRSKTECDAQGNCKSELICD